MNMRIVKLFLFISAAAFILSKLFLYVDPNLSDLASDPAGSVGFSIGIIIGINILLIPFIVGYIRDIASKWLILALMIGAPFVGGFLSGFVGAGETGLEFVNSIITPISWVVALVWAIVEKKPIS
jgi:hypothetical protein